MRPGFDFHRRYTVAEFAALPEDASARYELQDGCLVVSRNPPRQHQHVMAELSWQIDAQLPASLTVVPAIEIDLRLAAPVVRVPDLVVIPRMQVTEPGILAASTVALAVEVVSDHTLRTDTRIKPLDYADAGIPNLWLVDPSPPVTATILTLVDGGYQKSQRTEHSFTVTQPRPLTIDLDSLLD